MRLETEDDIQRLIDDRIPENYILEYKKEPWPEKKGKNTASEIAKDISSFANTQGGQIIVGVEEDKNTKEPIARHPFEISNWEERIENIRHNAIKPYIEGLRIYRIKSDEQKGKAYLIVEIPESPNTPHMVTTSNKYYRRDNTGAKPMSETEVAALYKRRQEQEKSLREYYRPLFDKLDEEKTKLNKNATQWFCLFLPRLFKRERLNLYDKKFLNFLQDTVNEFSSDDLQFPDSPPSRKGDFLQYHSNNHHDLPNIWIHPSGGILVISFMQQQKTDKYVINTRYFVNFIEAAFNISLAIFSESSNTLELKTIIDLKNVGTWRIENFWNYYPEKWNEPVRNFHGALPPFFPTPRDGKPDIVIERYLSLWQMERKHLQQFLKKNVFLEVLRKFDWEILDDGETHTIDRRTI